MRLVKANALNSWNHLKESRTLAASEYIEFSGNEVPPPYKLVFVSHRWITAMHPDPHNLQLMELKQRLSNLPAKNGKNGPLLVFFDYCSLPQLPRSAEENLWFERDLRSLESLSRLADYFIILSEGYRDYANRAWCFFEAITARENAHFFSDQNYIKEELKFRTFLMAEDIRQITAYDLSYKPKASEVEIIVAVFQHLQNCRVTHSKDAPKIKDQLIAHYNKRRLASFGKLVVGIIKHFDVEFAIMPVEDPQKVLVCKPFFEHPDWVRLPSLETLLERFMGGRNSSSLFALPRQVNEDIKRQHHQGFQPLLRLSISGVYNFQNFLEDYKNKPDWKKYVVDPAMLGEKGDCFPEIDNVIHTILELTSGFFLSKDRRYVYFFLSERQMQKKKASVLMLDKDGQVIDNSIWELFKKGESLYSSGRYAEAASCYGEALKTNPQNADAWFNKGNSLYYLGNYKEAINCYRETLKINSKYALAMYNKGLAEDRLGTGRDAAISSYRRFINLASAKDAKYVEIARKRLQQLEENNRSSTGHFDEPKQRYDKAQQGSRQDAEAWNSKGVNLDSSGRYNEALECYNKALQIHPESALTWYNKGGCLISLKRYYQAIQCSNKALEINPRYALAWYNKAVAEDQLDLREDAAFSYRKLIELASPREAKYVETARKRLRDFEEEERGDEHLGGLFG
jgi:tetratricopeptide (TPR) repeat protein